MNILNSFSHYTIPLFKESIIAPLTAQEKRILLIASLAFSFLTACYLLSRCPFQITWIDPANTDLDDQSNEIKNKNNDLDFHSFAKKNKN